MEGWETMRATVTRSMIDGVITAPPSKSYTHRALVCSALAKGRSIVHSPLICDDTEATVESLKKLGTQIHRGEAIDVFGGDLREADLFCRESGTTMRFMTTVCSLIDGRSVLTGGQSLLRRPVGGLVDAVRQLGAKCRCQNGFPPVTVEGPLKGGKAEIQGDITSQYISALLLAAPLAERQVSVRVTTPLQSRKYVLMTIRTQKQFGVEVETSAELDNFRVDTQRYRPTGFDVEGDWSAASLLLVAGAIAGRIEVVGVNLNSLQPDAAILSILQAMGSNVRVTSRTITIEKSELSAVNCDVSQSPDLFPAVAALCASASGVSRITGITRLRRKESDRVSAVREGLAAMGVRTRENGGSLLIEGGRPSAAVIDPKNDHRIAMAFALLALATDEKSVIRGAECVSKSFPTFWSSIKSIGANVEMMS